MGAADRAADTTTREGKGTTGGHRGTALVTGASAGLGVEFARALAARGHDLILTARRADRLEALASELRAGHGVAVTVVALDLSAPGAAEQLIGEIGGRGLAVNILINNAGFGLRGAFVEMDHRRVREMVELNCTAVMELCQLVLPGMIQMRRGAILNLASIAGFQPGPWMAVYYATKAFVVNFSEALHEEVRRHGVRVTALAPGPTRTEFGEISGLARSKWFNRVTGDGASVVAAGLAALDRGRPLCVPGFPNRLMLFLLRLTPRGMARRTVARVQKMRGG